MRPEQRRHFRTCLGEAEDIVDKEQHILALVAEIFRDRQARQADTRARARRLVHLAIDEGAFRALGRALLRILVDARFDHLVIEVVAFARAFADAGEHRIAAMFLGDVVDEFLDQHGLADTGAAEQSDLAAARIGGEQIDDLDARDKHLRFGRLVDEGGGFRVDGRRWSVLIGPASSTGSPMTLMIRPSVASPTGTEIGRTGIGHRLAAHQAFGRVHRNRADRRFAQMLGHFEHEAFAHGCRFRARS